jgi:integrase
VVYYSDEYPTFHNFINKSIKKPEKAFVHDKIPPTREELEMMIDTLEKSNRKYKKQYIAYLKFTFETGCRRAEALQLLKEVATYEPQTKMVKIKDENGNETEMESIAYKTHDIRCKGRNKVGKVRQLQFGEGVMESIKKWLEVRGNDDCPYVFVRKTKTGLCNQLAESTFNDWCNNLFEKIIGRRMHPHLFRESRATNLVVYEKKSIEIARKLLGHESSETTKIYVISTDDSDAFDAFV